MHEAVRQAIQDPSLTEFTWKDCDTATPEDCQILVKHCPQLRSLILDCPCDDLLECLPLFPHLRELFVEGADAVSEQGLEPIWTLSQLKYFTFWSYHNLDKEFLYNLCRLEQLVSVNLSVCEHIFNEDIPIFSRLKNLKSLYISYLDYFNDDGMEALGKLIQLRGLDVAHNKITDKGVEHLTSLVNLKHLNLTRCRVSDQCIDHIVKLQNLEMLNLSRCENISERSLLKLNDLLNLRVLYMGNCPQITEQIKNQLTSCKVDLDHTCVNISKWYLATKNVN
jgi:hypothetical protein